MKNKVLFFLGDGIYPYKIGGMEVFNYYLVRSMMNQMEVQYLSTSPFDFEGAKWIKMKHIRPIKFFYPLQLFLHCLLHPSHKHVLRNIGGEDWITDLMLGLVIRILRLKVVGVIHYGKAVPTDAPKVYKFFFNSLTHLVAVSDEIKKNYDKAYGTNCKVIYPLVPFEHATKSREDLRTEYGVPQDAKVICMVGTIKRMKNPDTLIDAISQMTSTDLEDFNPFALYAGGGAMIEQLRKFAIEKNVENRVKFLGNVPKNKVCEIMRLSDIYLIASDFEGTSVSLLEAMFNKKQIITSRAPGLVDMVEEGRDALMFETRDPSQLKNCIISYLSDDKKAKIMSENAFIQYESVYSYDKTLKSYINLFK